MIIQPKLENGSTTTALEEYTASSGQIGQLKLFALYEKSLGPKIKTLAWSEPKLEKRQFYHRFGGTSPIAGKQDFSNYLHCLLGAKFKTLA